MKSNDNDDAKRIVFYIRNSEMEFGMVYMILWCGNLTSLKSLISHTSMMKHFIYLRVCGKHWTKNNLTRANIPPSSYIKFAHSYTQIHELMDSSKKLCHHDTVAIQNILCVRLKQTAHTQKNASNWAYWTECFTFCENSKSEYEARFRFVSYHNYVKCIQTPFAGKHIFAF